ncbi:hypothetical protein H2203_006671 [Taxawa tesnikishii (nom. ined.)]|nr:hypothetical protein H2203_006671 [Dothideales sp. JES 119]
MDLGWLLGRARTSFHHPTSTISLPTSSGSKISLHDMCRSVTPPCNLNPFLFNGHLQTAWTVMKSAGPPIVYKRRIFSATNPKFAGTFAVDFVTQAKPQEPDNMLPPRTSYFTDDEWKGIASDDTKPMLITLHGLSGGSHEIYLRHVLAPLVADTQDGGWEALVVNSRGCAMSEITSGILYNARATWDVRQVVKWCREVFPNRPLYAIGYSLGANILTNYVGEEGDACELQAAVVCSNPWKLEVSSLALQRTWLGLEVYSKVMGSNMKKLFERHAEQVLKNGNIDPERGLPDGGAYYRDASSADSLLNVKIPFFAIHAEDDPIAVDEAVPYEEFKQNPYTVLCSTSMGGHLSWFEFGGERWFAKPAVNFLQKMAHENPEHIGEGKKATNASGYRSPFMFEPVRRKLRVENDPTYG